MLWRTCAVVILSASAWGCSVTCPAIECFDSLDIRTSAELPERYTVEIATFSGSATITCDRSTASEPGWIPGQVSGDLELSAYCRADGVQLTRPLPELEVRFVAEGGAVLGEQRFVPEYDPPPGTEDECGRVCSYAEV